MILINKFQYQDNHANEFNVSSHQGDHPALGL